MVVTKIQEINKKKVLVTLDQEFSFALYKGELRSFKIVLNQEISDEALKQIMEEVLPRRAKLRAMNLLKVRPYTEYCLRTKLKEGGYPENIVNIAIEYVASFHYIDDSQYAADFVDTYKDRKSRRRIFQELSQKGISKDLIYQAFDSLNQEDMDFEKDQIKKILIKKHYSPDWPYEDKQKLLAYLYRKGYSVDIDSLAFEDSVL